MATHNAAPARDTSGADWYVPTFRGYDIHVMRHQGEQLTLSASPLGVSITLHLSYADATALAETLVRAVSAA